MIKDLALLSALEELQDSQFSDYLNELVKEFSDNLIAESSTEETLRLVGGMRVLKRIIKDIENASTDKEKLRDRENKPDSKHFF